MTDIQHSALHHREASRRYAEGTQKEIAEIGGASRSSRDWALMSAASADTAKASEEASGRYRTQAAASASEARASAAQAAVNASLASAAEQTVTSSISRAELLAEQAAGHAGTSAQAAADAGSAAGQAAASASSAQDAGEAAQRSASAAAASEAAASASAESAAASEATALAAASIPPPECTELGVVIGENSVQLTWKDPENLIIDGWAVSEWQRTVCVLGTGSFPASPEDGVIVAATSRSPETDPYPLPEGVAYALKNSYIDSSITVAVPSGDTACLKLFSCARNGAWNALPANDYPTYTSYSWGQLAEYADAGTLLRHLPLGSALDMEHADFPGHQWIVAGSDMFTPENPAAGHTAALLSRYVLFTDKADNPEVLWAATEDTAAVGGVVYGIMKDGTVTAMQEGTDWNPGDVSCTFQGTQYPISAWYERNPNSSYYSSGSNLTSQRNDVQWMDSDGEADRWFSKRNLWDACSPSLAARPGFLRGLPQTVRDCLVPCLRTFHVQTAFQVRGRGKADTYAARVFPLNNTEIDGSTAGGVQEGIRQLDYFAGGESRIGFLQDGVTKTTWWSASPSPHNPYHVLYVSTSGAISGSIASGSCGFRPACALGKPVN